MCVVPTARAFNEDLGVAYRRVPRWPFNPQFKRSTTVSLLYRPLVDGKTRKEARGDRECAMLPSSLMTLTQRSHALSRVDFNVTPGLGLAGQDVPLRLLSFG